MRRLLTCAALAVAMTVATTAVAATAGDDPLNDPYMQKTLRAMRDASTWYHPDLFGQYAGVRRYAHHEYQDALKYFEVGAYYADKFSQLSIGLMHLNGEGVPKDAAMAYAWLDLAAERKYPDFVATRDRVKAELTPAQLEQAQGLRATLEARYGDAVAKPRMVQQLRLGVMQMTGSHTGFDYGVSHAATKEGCGNTTAIGGVAVPVAGCAGSDIYAKSRWKPEQYFASRDAQWKATVSVGKLEEGSAAPAKSAPAPAEQH